MKSAGNDIVALQIIDKQRTCHSTFYSKFVTVSELSLYKPSQIFFENFVWLLWSIKEAVYKYLKRFDADLIFSPSKIVIQYITISPDHIAANFQESEWKDSCPDKTFYGGGILYNMQTLYFRSNLQSEFITTVVNDDANFNNVYWGVQRIEKDDQESQSKAVRTFALNKLNSLLCVDNIRIDKPTGYPVLLIGNELIDIPVSLAHHGNFVAYSFLFES